MNQNHSGSIFKISLSKGHQLPPIAWRGHFHQEPNVERISEHEFIIRFQELLNAALTNWKKLLGEGVKVEQYMENPWGIERWKTIVDSSDDIDISDLLFDSQAELGVGARQQLAREFFGTDEPSRNLAIRDRERAADLSYYISDIELGQCCYFLQCRHDESFIQNHIIEPLANALKNARPLVIIDYPVIPILLDEHAMVILRLDAGELMQDAFKSFLQCKSKDPLSQYIIAGEGPLIVHLRNIHNAKEKISGFVRNLVDCRFGGSDRSATTAVFLSGLYPDCRGSLALDPGVVTRCQTFGILV